MNSFGHVSIAKAIYKELDKQGISLVKSAFLWGNIRPDFTANLIGVPHHKENYINRLLKLKQKLAQVKFSNTFSFVYSRMVGELCHFYSDFFCLAHNKGYQGNMIEHVVYEWKECLKLKKLSYSMPEEAWPDVEEINGLFEAMHQDFLFGTPSVEREFAYSVRFCTMLVAALVRASFAEEYYPAKAA